MQVSSPLKVVSRIALLLATAIFLTACATSQDPAERTDGINDPYERQNRNVHAFNKELDTSLIRPLAQGYAVVPVEIRDRVNDFSDNISEPGNAINSLLQGDLRGVGVSVVRFAMNTTVGLAGFVDAASELGIRENQTDFGETLAVWGVDEGAYIELPLFGPSTQRDTVGLVVDFFTNPLTFATVDNSPERYIPPTARGAAGLNNRDKLKGTFDSVLYDSADSYALSRSIYLQNRRFELEGSTGEEVDPFATDPYGSPDEIDPYAE